MNTVRATQFQNTLWLVSFKNSCDAPVGTLEAVHSINKYQVRAVSKRDCSSNVTKENQ